MAFTRPTLQQIYDRVKTDITSGLNLTTLLLRSFLKVIGAALAGASHTLHGYISWALLQMFPDTAEGSYLIRWGTLFGINQLAATFTELNIEISGVNGTVVPAETTVFQRSDGVEYKVKDEVTIGVSGTVEAVVVALEAGDESNIDDGSIITLTSPISGVDSDAEVLSTAVEGESQEELEALRTRLLERMQNPPAGGTVADYIAFAKTVAGVTRVWVLPGYLGQGTVAVTFVEDGEDPIIPSAPKVEEVQNAIEELMPIEATLFVFAPIAAPINPVISITPNTLAVREAITAELEDLIFREAQVRQAIDPEQVSQAVLFTGKIPLSKFNEAISIASGENDHVLVSPSETPQPSEGGILTLGTITFQTLT